MKTMTQSLTSQSSNLVRYQPNNIAHWEIPRFYKQTDLGLQPGTIV